jgi:hypothetical protein
VHAVVVTVAIDPDQADAAQTVLNEQVLPRVSAATGFSTGHWTQNDDRTNGLSMVVFDTAENAQAAAEMAQNMPYAPGVTMQSVEVRAVVAHA